MADQIYNQLFLELGKGLDFVGDTVKLMLLADTYVPDTADHSYVSANVWVASTAYSVGDTVRPTTRNGHLYKCTVAGTSDASEPTWPTTDGQTVADGGATWECLGNADVSYHEVSGSGYTAGGKVLTNKSWIRDDVNNFAVFDADDVVWGNTMLTVRWAVLFKDTGGEATSPLIKVFDYGGNKISDGGNFEHRFDANGVLRIREYGV